MSVGSIGLVLVSLLAQHDDFPDGLVELDRVTSPRSQISEKQWRAALGSMVALRTVEGQDIAGRLVSSDLDFIELDSGDGTRKVLSKMNIQTLGAVNPARARVEQWFEKRSVTPPEPSAEAVATDGTRVVLAGEPSRTPRLLERDRNDLLGQRRGLKTLAETHHNAYTLGVLVGCFGAAGIAASLASCILMPSVGIPAIAGVGLCGGALAAVGGGTAAWAKMKQDQQERHIRVIDSTLNQTDAEAAGAVAF